MSSLETEGEEAAAFEMALTGEAKAISGEGRRPMRHCGRLLDGSLSH